MALDVRVVIDQKKILTGAGFGIPLIYAGLLETELPYTECANIDEVKLLFPEGTRAYSAASLLFGQTAPPARIAVYGGTDKALTCLPGVWEKDWRQLLVASEAGAGEENSLQEIAAYVDAKGDKIFFTSVKDTAAVTGSGKAITSFMRTICMYHPDDVDCPEAALVGATAGQTVGSLTYKNQMLNGLAPAQFTDAQVAAAEQLGCYCVVKKAGDTVTSEGKTAGGEYLDVVDSRDYIVREIEYRTQRTLNAAPKISYDNNGIALLENVCVDVLANAYANGIIAVDDKGLPDYTANYAPRSETQASDRHERRYVEGRFSFALAGAVHEAVIHGTIEI